MHTQEKKTIRFSMVVLFLALMIVYMFLFQIKWKEFKNSLNKDSDSTSWDMIQITAVNSWQSELISSFLQEENRIINQTSNINKINTWKSDFLTWFIQSQIVKTGNINKSSTWKTQTKLGNIRILSWTDIYYWTVDSIEKLWIKYQYALLDSQGIYYVYLGNPAYDFDNIVRKLKWNLYTLNTEQDIFNNKLFWDKIVFINLPEYKNNKVVMLVYISNDVRLIQIDYSIYYKSKNYIKSLFYE